jgi:hypothetical protein
MSYENIFGCARNDWHGRCNSFCYRPRMRCNHWSISAGGAMKSSMTEFSDLGAEQYQQGQLGCVCGRHRSQGEHDYEARRMLECVSVVREPRRFDGLLARKVMRTNFPKG